MTPKAILFDLDDTLADHQFSVQIGLVALAERHACLLQRSFEDLQETHAHYLELFHDKVIRGDMSLDAARIERFQRIFAHYGEPISSDEAGQVAGFFRQAYLASERAIPGVIPFLEYLRAQNIKVGIITNGVIGEQTLKLRRCGLESYIDLMVTAEETRTAKPDPAIFHYTLERFHPHAAEVLMIGDNWWTDIIGAAQLGLRALWLNRYGLTCPDTSLATEFTTYEPLEEVLSLIV
ncbi:MAG: HAD family hydrolase [Chloroflexi bacterium]|nr:HAD family hydrolase [Chloroflexota bacterium]